MTRQPSLLRRDIAGRDAERLTLVALVGLCLLTFVMCVFGQSSVFQFHMFLITLLTGFGATYLMRREVAWKSGALDTTGYADQVVKFLTIATIFWGCVGFLMGDIIAWQLVFPALNLELPWTTFGRLRPLHTSAVVFAFGGNALIGTSFYVVQRTCGARLFGHTLPWVVAIGYQLFLIMAATGYLMGVSQGKEYAEPQWYADIYLTIIWVCYFFVFAGTLLRRKQSHIYVANWFYLAFIVVIAMLHIVNNMALPVSLFSEQSVTVWSGVQDAMIQWWYGHNAVGFLLTAGFLGMMYYFVPKRAERPVYSYRLSIVHFWALSFMYIWAGPHHLHFTALPDWTQTLGMVLSIMLWMPSWGGMINGLMTLSGAWDKLRTDPVIRFMVVAVAFYGMSTFEGPLMAIKEVNALSHYTEWTVGHVHSGALGWVGFITFGAVYCLVAWLWGKGKLYSVRLVEWHFWLANIGVLLYITSMWVAGIMQGVMWRSYDDQGFLTYTFMEIVAALHPYYAIRAIGGLLYVTGALLMAYNAYKTIQQSKEEKQQLASSSVQSVQA